MYLKSPFPDIPSRPVLNVHHLFFNRPDQSEWPDFTLHIDAVTGRKVKFRDFLNRVRDGATALAAPVPQGGLDIRADENELVGILSDNSSVSSFTAKKKATSASEFPFRSTSLWYTHF